MRNTSISHLQLLAMLGGAVVSSQIPTLARTGSNAVKPKVSALPPGNWKYALESDPLENTWAWTAPFKGSGSDFETRVVFNRSDDNNFDMLRIAGKSGSAKLRFWRVTDGIAEKLGEPEVSLPGGSGQLTLQRSAWRVRALWNGVALISAPQAIGGGEGKWTIGQATKGAADLGPGRMQPTEPVDFRDDFMRAQGPDDPEVPGEWHRVSGVWKTSGIIGPRADALLNPNPFVFRSEPAKAIEDRPEATVGKWFWNDYVVESAVRPSFHTLDAPLVAGVSAYRQADGTAVVGEIDFQTGTARLRLGDRILAESKPFLGDTDQWHRLFLDPGPGTMRVIVDGIERVRYDGQADVAGGAAPATALAQGEASLVSHLGGDNSIDFDDVRIAESDSFSEDFKTPSVGRWSDLIGGWQTRPALVGRYKGAQLLPARRVKTSVGPGLCLANAGTNDAGRIEATFLKGSATGAKAAAPETAFGAVFAARDAGTYMVAKVTPRAVQIVQFQGGAGSILGTSSIAPTNDSVEVEWQGGTITARSGSAIASAIVNSIDPGRAGVWERGAPGAWSVTGFHALGIGATWGEHSLPERFAKDRLMHFWASNASMWRADDGFKMAGKNETRWNVGDFFNDATIDLPLPDLTTTTSTLAAPAAEESEPTTPTALASGQSITLYAGASPETPDAGSRLAITRTGDQVKFELAEAGTLVKDDTLEVADAHGDLRFARRPVGDGTVSLRVALGDKVIFNEIAGAAGKTAGTAKASEISLQATSAADTSPGSKVGIATAGGATIDWNSVEAHSSNVLDYSFTGAPTDWRAGKGFWDVTERWTCSPQWGFFAGVKSVNPTLWSRFATRGDWTLEAYIATPMDISRGERGPSDLNITVGADGRDLSSGYSFLFGANGRASNRIYRGDAMAAESAFIMPALKGSTHQDWFYVRLERRQTPQGLRFRYSVNGVELWNYLDPHPLGGADDPGHIAFWTYNGGLSIARVRLWYTTLDDGEAATQGLSTAGYAATATGKPSNAKPVQTVAVQSAHAVQADLKNPLGTWDSRHESLTKDAAHFTPIADPKIKGLSISDAQSGGDWTVYVTRHSFDAGLHPTIKFRYKIPAGVLVNLYALVDGNWREIAFTGSTTPLPLLVTGTTLMTARGGAPMGWGIDPHAGMDIGSIDGVSADGAWHDASFDLQGALQKAGLPATVDALAFAAPDRDYLRAGLGGNHLGATYSIADFDAPVAQTKVAGLQ